MHKHASLVTKPLAWKSMSHIYPCLLFLCIAPLSVCLSFLFSYSPLLEIWRTSTAIWNSCEFYTILTWELNIKVKPMSHCRRDWCFLSHLQHKLTAREHERQQSWPHTHILGKQHLNFTVISSALPMPCISNVLLMQPKDFPNIQIFAAHPHLGKPAKFFTSLIKNNTILT